MVSNYFSTCLDTLTNDEKQAAEKMVAAAFETWFDVLLKTLQVFYDDKDIQAVWLDGEVAG